MPGVVVQRESWHDYVRRCAGRDESALASLYDESSRLAYTVALRILQDEADASEVVVDVYKQVWEGAAQFDERRGSVAAWIVMLSRSRAIDRRRQRSARGRQAATGLDEIPEVKSSEPNPEALAIDSQSSRTMKRALEALPAEQRMALELAFFDGLSHAEVATRLDNPWEPSRHASGRA
jgi:RNA polymerase sigma-70 factor (ECF subfamily)